MATDWREQGQEEYLSGLAFTKRKYEKYSEQWDHDHCEFCSVKFSDEDDQSSLREGYATPDKYRWICEQCFLDFKEKYHLIESEPR